MYKNYKVYVNTAAGRRRYMQYLIPYIVSCPLVDRYDIWINTHDGADIEFFKRIADAFPVVNLVWQPDGIVDGNKSINAFYLTCTDPDAIYFKLDDDIVWMEPDAIEKMIRFRIDHPEYQIVSPLVINNSLSTYQLQIENKIELDTYYHSDSSHPVLWKDPVFALELHRWFLNQIESNGVDNLHIGQKAMGMTRFSINAILWFGSDMASIKGIVPGDDEEFLSCIWSTKTGKPNCWNGDAIIAHFAFFTQRQILDKNDILNQYGEMCLKQWKEIKRLQMSGAIVKTITDKTDSESDILKHVPSPYKAVNRRKSLRTKIKESLPPVIQAMWAAAYDYTHTRKHDFIKQ
ncbi:MAG: hypothetical protein MJZ04_00530 [Bacteroidales bacterium]|nr:hypothetical protein [Bacteroidales bacterium]